MNRQHEKVQIEKWLANNNFCAMPFFHVAIESNGDVRPCCLGTPLKNDDGTTLNIEGKTINDIINHPTHVKFRQSFLNNEQHPACNDCWGVYHGDKFSGRYVYSSSSKVSDYVVKIINGEPIEQRLVWLEIKAGNRCNLACRICGLWNSAKWLKETYEIKKQQRSDYPDFKNSPEFKYNQQAKWIDDIEFWKNIDGFEDIRIMHLMGGEPLMIEEHFEMLDAVANKFNPKDIYVWYNTNGTLVPTLRQEQILDRYKTIMWSLSIDDFGDKFDYQRSGATWEDVKKNLRYFYSRPNFQTNIDATISIYNIATLDQFILEIDKLKFVTDFTPHYVTSPNGYSNVRTLHKDIKAKITDHLLNSKKRIPAIYHHCIDTVLNFMNSIDAWSEEIDQRRKNEIALIDKFRNESFVKTFPEMARLLKYE
jgi:MoaA/NifB/PqqE/SkfB family radical SAM enzyme